MDAEAIALARLYLGQVTVPAITGDLRQVDASLLPSLIEQAEPDALGHLGE